MNFKLEKGTTVSSICSHTYIIVNGQGSADPYWEKLCRPRAVLKTEGTVFRNTHRPWPVNNIFISPAKKITSPRSCNELRNKSARGRGQDRKIPPALGANQIAKESGVLL